MSEMNITGYSKNHVWEKGITNRTLISSEKFTEWKCVKCGVGFYHFYDLVPDIQKAMKQEEITEECTEAA